MGALLNDSTNSLMQADIAVSTNGHQRLQDENGRSIWNVELASMFRNRTAHITDSMSAYVAQEQCALPVYNKNGTQ